MLPRNIESMELKKLDLPAPTGPTNGTQAWVNGADAGPVLENVLYQLLLFHRLSQVWFAALDYG